MEPSFQTSFIPKKPMIEKRAITSESLGFLSVIGIFLLITVLILTGGLYFYKNVLAKNISTMESNLNLAKNRFEPAKIAELQLLDKRLRASSEILSKHIVVTPIFKILQDITMKTIRYTKFSYSVGSDKESGVKIKMTGVAVGYSSVALQSDLFTKNKNLIDPIFSNLVLDDKGNVTFDLEFSVDPTLVDYKQMLLTEGFNLQQ
jgi:hypothetical protein